MQLAEAQGHKEACHGRKRMFYILRCSSYSEGFEHLGAWEMRQGLYIPAADFSHYVLRGLYTGDEKGCSHGCPALQEDSAQQTQQPTATSTAGWTAAHACSRADISGASMTASPRMAKRNNLMRCSGVADKRV